MVAEVALDREVRAPADLGGVGSGGGLHEAGAVHVVLVVGVPAGPVLAVPVRRRVLHPYRRRPVAVQDPGYRLDELVLRVRERLLDRGAGGELGVQRGYPAVPQAAQALGGVPAGGAGLPQHQPHQVDLRLRYEDVELGLAAPGGGYDRTLPRAGAVPGGHLRVCGADAVLPGLRVVGAVGGLFGVGGGAAVGLVAAVGLAGGEVGGGDLGAGQQGSAEVRVHEEQVVVGVGDDLDDRTGGDARGPGRGRVLLLGGLGGGLLATGHGEHTGGAGCQHGEQGREAATGHGHRVTPRVRSGREKALNSQREGKSADLVHRMRR